MKDRELIGGAAFPPDALKVIFQAFDDAWDEIGPSIKGRPDATESARLSLAGVILSLARAGPIERDALKVSAVSAFGVKHPRRSAT
jgi:hypothetical protein